MEDYEKIFNEYKRGERKVPQISMGKIGIIESAGSNIFKELEKIKKEFIKGYVKNNSKKVEAKKLFGIPLNKEHIEVDLDRELIEKYREEYLTLAYEDIPELRDIESESSICSMYLSSDYQLPNILSIRKPLLKTIQSIHKCEDNYSNKQIVDIFKDVENYNILVNHFTKILSKYSSKDKKAIKKPHKTDEAKINKCLKNMVTSGKLKNDSNNIKFNKVLHKIYRFVDDVTYKIYRDLPCLPKSNNNDLSYFDILFYVKKKYKDKDIKEIYECNTSRYNHKLKIYDKKI
ncbi:MAG: hypothetical protein KAJ54_01010 [Candidatus Aenigmarchaeota archaeon]|nr:hypothetical protein [Candidatus Aenigmarchaeota archaeon]